MDLGNAGVLLTVGAALVIGMLLFKKFEVEFDTEIEVNKQDYDIEFDFEFKREKEKKKKNKKNRDGGGGGKKSSPKERMTDDMEYQTAKDTSYDIRGPYEDLMMPTLY